LLAEHRLLFFNSMAHVSNFTLFLFLSTTAISIWLFFKAAQNDKRVLFAMLSWTAVVALLAISGFYQKPDASPPRVMFLLIPNLAIVLGLFGSKGGRKFIDSLDLKWLTALHIVRIPVEICLYFFYLNALVPVEMTFEGYNWDILSGITAAGLYYFVYISKRWGKKALLLWNIGGLILLFNILVIAMLSAKTPFQQIGFEQPNIAVTYFPFIWLPTVIVLLVLISHLAAIRKLTKS